MGWTIIVKATSDFIQSGMSWQETASIPSDQRCGAYERRPFGNCSILTALMDQRKPAISLVLKVSERRRTQISF